MIRLVRLFRVAMGAVVLAALVSGAQAPLTSQAQAQLRRAPDYPSRVCEGARDVIERDRDLLQAMRNAFARVNYWGVRRNDPRNCLYPVKFLKFHLMDILFTIGNEPGEQCANCRARLTAHLLRNRPGTPKVLKRVVNFASLGKYGDPGEIEAFKIGGNEGIGVESLVSIKGKDFKQLSFFIVQRNELVELKMDKPLLSGFDTTDRVADKGQAVAITSEWRVDPIRTIDLIVDYDIRRGDVQSDVQLIFRREGDRLILLSGQMPPELLEEGDR